MKLRLIFIYCFLLISAVQFGQNKEISSLNWFNNLEKARKIAKKEQKPILVYFTGSDWCKYCMMLEEDFFNSLKFKESANNMILIKIDFPRKIDVLSKEQLDYNKKVIAKYNKEKTFPKLIILNYKAKVLGKLSGYSSLRDPNNHFDFIDDQLLRWNKKLD